MAGDALTSNDQFGKFCLELHLSTVQQPSYSSRKLKYFTGPFAMSKGQLELSFKHAAASAAVLAMTIASSSAYATGSAQGGMASWYGPGFQGRRTASGERFNSFGYTAAHRFYPLGCRVRVTNRENGRSVVVRINDRGPYARGRVIDLSYASARAIGMSGTAPVSLARM